VRVLPADADRDTWLAARRQGIGSSDVAAIVGASTYSTPLHVWHDKRGELPDREPSEPMLWGSLLEDTVAREWARRCRSVIHRVGLVANVDQPWQLATLDRRVLECPLNRDREACALEVKCRSAFTSARWHADVPDDVLAQVIWQMIVTGYRHIHVMVLIGGNTPQQTVVRWDQAVADYVLGEVARFRDEHLLRGVPPVVDDPATAAARIELDEALHPDRSGEIDLDGIGEVMSYAEISAAKGAADRRLKAARATRGELAAGRRFVTFAGEPAYELAPVTRTSCDLARLAERHPAAYADCVRETTTHTIRIAADYRVRSTDGQ
jgi:putative phage-type endonuclease